MRSFLHSERPIVTGMLKETTEAGLFAQIERLRREGVDAYGLQLEELDAECKTEMAVKMLLSAMSDKPVYVTNYLRRNATPGIGWDALAEGLLLAAEHGATLLDVPGDMFASADMELTLDAEAIKKQRRLIDALHQRGAEVLMSSHVLRYVPSETVLTVAREHIARGADITKIVTAADSPEELTSAFETQHALTRLDHKFLFLCGGTYCRKHRLLGPLFGSCMFLVTENALRGHQQPTVSEARRVLACAELSATEDSL